MEPQPILRTVGLKKTYGSGEHQVQALTDIDLSIYPGEIFGVIGLSGAGKSTLVRCMNLLERPTEGQVFFDGLDLAALSPAQLRQARRSIGMIFQQFNLLMQSNALDNVCFPMLISGVSKKEAKRRAGELLETVGLGDKKKAYPAQLSGGQKQRVAIARALAMNPKVLLCDEATSALDPTTTRSLLTLLREINEKLGITIIIITHEMRVIEETCTRVAIIDDSRIAEIGEVKDVFEHPKSAIAKKLVFHDGERAEQIFEPNCFRIVFDGEEAFAPIISDMVLNSGAPVNILFADTKTIDEKVYGHMVVKFPEDAAIAAKMQQYLTERGIRCEEVTASVY